MVRGYITKNLGREARLGLILGVILGLLMLLWAGVSTRDILIARPGEDHAFDWFVVIVFGPLGLAFLTVAACSSVRLWKLDRHKDLVALDRYGDRDKLLRQIEDELEDRRGIVRVGRTLRSFDLNRDTSELSNVEVLLTPSWVVSFPAADRVQFLRVDDIVWAYREGEAVMAADRHGVRLRLVGEEGPLRHVLAEILLRVPWALSHHDDDTERKWTSNSQQIVTEVDVRRREIMARRPPASVPSPDPDKSERTG
jgi:hypothetical protein